MPQLRASSVSSGVLPEGGDSGRILVDSSGGVVRQQDHFHLLHLRTRLKLCSASLERLSTARMPPSLFRYEADDGARGWMLVMARDFFQDLK